MFIYLLYSSLLVLCDNGSINLDLYLEISENVRCSIRFEIEYSKVKRPFSPLNEWGDIFPHLTFSNIIMRNYENLNRLH